MARILIIEDNDADRESLEELLVLAQHNISSAPNGKVAMQILRERRVELVITDMLMPEMDGVETIVALRRDYPDIKIIAVSGGGVVSSGNYLRLAKGLGAQFVLPKPFTASEILDAIQNLLAARQGFPES
jgi:CheY-like chemotaxis protein